MKLLADALTTHRVLGRVPKTALLPIAGEIIERRYKKGHYFFRTGDSASHIFAIVSGSAMLAEDDDSGRDHALYTLSDGDLFGLAAAILGIPRTRSAKALTDAQVLLIKRETFQSLQRRFPDFARNVTFELCRLLCHAEQTAGNFALHSVTSRVTKLFLESGFERLEPHFSSHHELAARVGCSRETITRILGRLERAGILSARRGHVQILDRGKLRTLAYHPR
jgi:CRP/FNR family transcriptional regulator, cyclic AMP receptor protein